MDHHELQLVLRLHSCQKVVGNQYPHDFAIGHSRESKKPADVSFEQRPTLRTRFKAVLVLFHTGGGGGGGRLAERLRTNNEARD